MLNTNSASFDIGHVTTILEVPMLFKGRIRYGIIVVLLHALEHRVYVEGKPLDAVVEFFLDQSLDYLHFG